ncbi:uncharacterized protein LOC135499338 [Lineus longissimus]|uniref:uncharacterized protein LOC135499338 n=1 Tax=Lineus longissimus TaxID=88925 RepID=UPI00315C9983
MKHCKRGIRPTPSERRELISLISGDMIALGCPKRATIKRVAKSIVAKYPDSLEDKNTDGRRLGNGYQSLFTKLENKIYNEGQKKRRLQRQSELKTGEAPKRNAQDDDNKDRYGCIEHQWKPKMPEGEMIQTQEEKKGTLKSFGPEYDSKEVTRLMSETYFLQRKNICENSTVKELMVEWPFLFKYECLSVHFEHLTGVKIDSAYKESLVARNKGFRIWEFLSSTASGSKKSNKLKTWISLVTGNREAVEKDGDKPETPFIAIIDAGEEKPVGIIVTFKAYDNSILIFFRELVGINPEKMNTKRKKNAKKVPIHPRIVSLLNGTRDFESDWGCPM